MAAFLADTSIWGWAASGRRPDIQEKLASRFERGELVTCVPVALETLHRARGEAEYESLRASLFAPLEWLALDETASARALEVQRAMARGAHGNQMRPAVDYLIAAIAEGGGPEVTLWAFDRDLELICQHTGQPREAETAAR